MKNNININMKRSLIIIAAILAGLMLVACTNPFFPTKHHGDGSGKLASAANGGKGGSGPAPAAKDRYYVVTFEPDGGTPVPGDQNVAPGGMVTKVPPMRKTGYGFGGWFSDPARTNEWHFNTDKVNSNMTLYAKWVRSSSGGGGGGGSSPPSTSPSPPSSPAPAYTIHFNAEGGNPEPGNQVLTTGAKVIEPAPLRKSISHDPDRWHDADVWWGFDGWYEEEEFITEWHFASDRVSSDMTLYAKWHEEVHCLVTFNANGGVPVPRNQDLISGARVAEPYAVNREGFGFGGWYTDSRLTNLWDFSTDRVSDRNITLFAKWVSIDHTVSFNANGGTPTPANLTVAHNSLISVSDLPVMSRENYGFDGWYADSSLTYEWDFATREVTDNVTLYAKWHTDFIVVSFNIDSGASSMPEQFVTAGSRVSEPSIADTNSLCFDGWYEDTAFRSPWDFLMDTVSADKTLYGRWVPNRESEGLAWVRGGGFTMGDNSVSGAKPAHRVKVSGFYMNKYLVTQAEYLTVMGVNPSSSTTSTNLPVNNVSWSNAAAYCSALGFRLPTEAEWEYAARGGNNPTGNYPFAGAYDPESVAWFNSNSGKVIKPVGTKAPNDLGIYDMSGNLAEWCSDWLGDYTADPQVNPTGPSSGTKRVTRGGSWDNASQNTRVVVRGSFDPDSTSGSYPFWTLGIRCITRP